MRSQIAREHAWKQTGDVLHERVKLMWKSREAYDRSLQLHGESWAAIMAKYAATADRLQRKLDAEIESLDLTPEEKRVLSLSKRRNVGGAAGGGGPMTPSNALKAMLGFVIPMLGKYATDVALQWLNAEIKYLNTTVTGAISSGPGFNLLNGLLQGIDYNQRVGNSVRILGINWLLNLTTSAAATETIYRFMLVVDTQANEAAPTSADLSEGAGTFAVGTLVPNILASPDRFVFLHDETITLSSLAKTAHHSSMRLEDLVKQDLHTLFSTTGATIAAISRGSLYLVHVSDQAANTPTVQFNCRVFYEDT